MQLLEAAALAEKPFLDANSAASIDLGLRTVSFRYQYLLILLARSSSRMKTQCTDSSKTMLRLLENMVSDSEETYNGIVWQLLCCPFTPFLVLFGEILSNGNGESEENKEYLAAIEQLPIFLGKMSLRNSLAVKLERIAVVFVQHARSVVHTQGKCKHERFEHRSTATDQQFSVGPRGNEAPQGSGSLNGALPDPWPSTGDTLSLESLFYHATTAPISGQPETSSHDAQPIDSATWSNDFFGDSVFDWIGWDSQV